MSNIFPKKNYYYHLSLFCCVQRLLFNYISIQWEEKLDGAISQYILKALHEEKKKSNVLIQQRMLK